ncbi:hypothetical protein Cgig2_014788 [Carnegiea gigantea]|uniref:Uncharacterized protein n=1 Tax=Carnegiea gigantea TaxID=171969 RepID=A0A9Q1L1N8_9CARY|nr:hypothetical protein Cgig2_014788 [Carnegiea gigantea]
MEEKREAVDVINPRELSAKMLKNYINLNGTSYDLAIGHVTSVLNVGVLLTELEMQTTIAPNCPKDFRPNFRLLETKLYVIGTLMHQWETCTRTLDLDVLEREARLEHQNTQFLDSRHWHTSAEELTRHALETLLKYFGETVSSYYFKIFTSW